MIVRLDRFWRRSSAPSDPHLVPVDSVQLEPPVEADRPQLDSIEDASQEPPLPEQPTPLPPIAGAPRPRSGVLVPLRASRSRLAPRGLPLAHVSKRAILAVGVCAGLAAPVVTRHLATRALMSLLGAGSGPSVAAGRWHATSVEIIRVTSGSSRPGEAAATIGKILEQLKR
jgi:hypothetical protein